MGGPAMAFPGGPVIAPNVSPSSIGAVPDTRTVTAGAGLTGGGTLAADRTIDVGANADGSIVVNADDVQVGVISDAQHGARGATDGGAGLAHPLAAATAPGLQPAGLYVRVVPTGVAATDTAAVQAALTAMAAKGTVVPGDGACAIQTTQHCPTGTRLEMAQGARIASTIVPGIGPDLSVLHGTTTYHATTTTLAENAVVGASQLRLTSTAAPPIVRGSVIRGGILDYRLLTWQVYGPTVTTGTVDLTGLAYPGAFGVLDITVNINGTGYLVTFANPANAAAALVQINAVTVAHGVTASLQAVTNYLVLTGTDAAGPVYVTDGTLAAATIGLTSGVATVPIDRPVVYPYTAAGSYVALVTAYPRDVQIDCHGATGTGSGTDAVGRFTEFHSAFDCTLEDLALDDLSGSMVGIGGSWDVGGRRNRFVRCRVRDTSLVPSTIGWMLETNEDSAIVDCTSDNMRYGLVIFDGLRCDITNGRARGGLYGAYIGCDGAFTSGSIDSGVTGGVYEANTYGVAVERGAVRPYFRGVLSSYNVSYNYWCDDGHGNVADPLWIDCASEGAAYGWVIDAGTTGARMVGCRADSATACGVAVGSDLVLEGFSSRGCPYSIQTAGAAGKRLSCSDFQIDVTGTAAGAVLVSGAGECVLDGGTITVPTNGIGIEITAAGAVLRLKGPINLVCAGGAAIGVKSTVAATVYLEGDVDLSAAALQFSASLTVIRLDDAQGYRELLGPFTDATKLTSGATTTTTAPVGGTGRTIICAFYSDSVPAASEVIAAHCNAAANARGFGFGGGWGVDKGLMHFWHHGLAGNAWIALPAAYTVTAAIARMHCFAYTITGGNARSAWGALGGAQAIGVTALAGAYDAPAAADPVVMGGLPIINYAFLSGKLCFFAHIPAVLTDAEIIAKSVACLNGNLGNTSTAPDFVFRAPSWNVYPVGPARTRV